jgi:hypothetical protein
MNSKKMFWISSYPKSGNTWLRLILCGLFFSEDGKIKDFKILSKIRGFDSLNNFKFIEKISKKDFIKIFQGKEYNEQAVLTYSKYWLEAQRRININNGKFGFFKTHNARVKINNNYYTDSSKSSGFIYISRDPRDVVVSYSKHMNKSIDDTIEFLLNGQIMNKSKDNNKMPEIILNWKEHYLSWKKFDEIPSLFLQYENLLTDIEKEIKKIINFFDKYFNISIENQNKKIQNIIKSTEFINLKKIEFSNGFSEKGHSSFFRIGEKNQWKKILNKKQSDLIEKSFNYTMDELNYIAQKN